MLNSVSNTNSFGHQYQRVNELRKNLEQTVKEFSKFTNFLKEKQHQNQHNQNDIYDYVDDDDNDSIINSTISECKNDETLLFEDGNRPLCLVYQSTASAFIQILGFSQKKMEVSRFKVSPTPNALPANTKRVACSQPLNIITSTESFRNQSFSDSELEESMKSLTSSKVFSIITTSPITSSTSPSNSLDSGVSSPSYDFLFHSAPNSAILSPPLITFNNSCSPFNYQRHHHRSTCFNCGKRHQIFMSCDGDSIKLYNNSIINCCQATERSRSSSLTIDALSNLNNSIDNFINNESKNQSLNNQNNNKTTKNLLEYNTIVNDNFNNTSSLIKKSNTYLDYNKETFLSNLNNNDSLNHLKGILKKPSFDCFCGLKSQQSHQINASSRFRLSRSVSECCSDNFDHSDFRLSNAFNGMMIDSGENLKMNETLCEDNDELTKSLNEDSTEDECNCYQLHKNNNNSNLSLNVDGDNESLDEPAELVPRKKCVSFSEHVQARIYRSNSSILGQKKKNEKKNRVKRRRSESENIDCLCEDILVGNQYSINEPFIKNKLDAVSNQDNENFVNNSFSQKRRDSGIENESNDSVFGNTSLIDNNKTLCMNCNSKNVETQQINNDSHLAKRIKRLVSTDSALGEEEINTEEKTVAV